MCIRDRDHYYHAITTKLPSLGLQPHLLSDETVSNLLETTKRYKDRVNFEAIRPTVNWRSTHSDVSVAGGAVGG